MKIKDNVYDFTPEIHKALHQEDVQAQKCRKDSDVLMYHNFMKDVGYTVIRDKSSERKTFTLEDPPKKVADIEARIVDDESHDLQGERVKISSHAK